MKKLVYILSVIVLIGCTKELKVYYSPSFKDDPIRNKLKHEALLEKDPIAAEMEEADTKLSRYEYIDSVLKDWPFPGAKGGWIPSRDGIENCDTIVEGFPYNRVV